ncbi:MAG: hypothetical protein L0Y56_13785, partial [Nitrospira sp.]|nr:hypothetical protein [Nitrospira sp.]
MPDLTPRQQAEQIVDGWIRGGVIPSEQRGQYLQLIAENEKVANAFAGGFMRRSEYSTRAQEVAEMRRKAQEDIQSERLRVQSDADRLRGWQTEVEKEVNRLRTIESRVPTLEAQLAAYKQLADDHQISDRLAYKAPETPTPPNPQLNYQPLTQNPM